MRILITTPVYPPDLGGPATFVPRLARYLARDGHRVTVLTFADAPVAGSGFEVVSVPRVFLPLRYAWFFVRLLQRLARADLLFACEHPRIFSLAAARLLGRKLVLRMMVDTAWELSFRRGYTTDDPQAFRRRRQRPAARLLQRLEDFALRRADLVMAVSEHLRQTAQRIGVAPERTAVSYNLPPDWQSLSTRVEARRRLQIPDETFQLLVVCRLVAWKGTSDILDAVEALDPPWQLAILGDGPQRRELVERIASSPILRSRVKLAGAVDRDTVRAYMKASDLLVLGSLYEGLSHVVLEAMAAGLPVVASDIPGNRELIADGENGSLFPYGDVHRLAGAIERLRADAPCRARYAACSRERLAKWASEHSPDRLAAALVQLATAESTRGADS